MKNNRGSLTIIAIFTVLIFSLYGILLYARSASSYIRQSKSIETIQAIYAQDVPNAVHIAEQIEPQTSSSKYTVSFIANAPLGKTANGTVADQYFTYGISQNLNANEYIVKGYIFTGWNTKADGTGTVFLDSQSVSNLSSIDGDTVNLYASWRVEKVSYTLDGNTMLQKMKKLAGTTGDNGYADNTSVTAIKWATESQYDAIKNSFTSDNLISSSSSDEIIYTWYDSSSETLYMYSHADIVKLAANSGRAFAKYSNLEDISFLSHFDTSEVEDMNRMFQGCYNINDLSPLKDWDVSSVTDMTFMFGSASNTNPMSIADLTPLKDWDVSNVESFYQTFKVCSSITTLDALKDWDVSSATNFAQMFNRCGLTDALAIKDWDVRNATYSSNTSNTSTGFGMMLSNTALPDSKKPIFTYWPGTWQGSNQRHVYS